MSEITGKTKNTDLPNLFPAPNVKPIVGINAVVVRIDDDGSLSLSLAIHDEKHKARLLQIANEIMRQGIAP